MFKKVMMVLISILAMIVVALLLARVGGLDAKKILNLLPISPQQVTGTGNTSLRVGVGNQGPGAGRFELIVRDKTGRLKKVIRAEMHPEASGRANLVNPVILLYDEKGQQTSIAAPNGFFDSDGIIGDLDDIKRGALTGGVTIRHNHASPDDPADDLVATMDHIDYDQKSSLLSTDDAVKIRSPENDVDAIGLRIFLVPEKEKKNAAPENKNTIKEIQFLKEVHIVMRRQSGKFSLGLGTETGPAAPPTATVPADTATAKTSPAPASAAVAKAAGPQPYKFTLKGHVKAVQEGSSLTGADELVLVVRSKSGAGGLGGSDRSGAVRSDSRPAGVHSATTPLRAPPAGSPATKPAPKAAGTTMDIVCDGPLVINPLTDPAAPEMSLAAKAADGREVVLVNNDLRTRSATLDYDGGTGAGLLTRTEKSPVDIVQGATKIVGDKVRFNRAAGTVHVDGPGRLDSVSGAGGMDLGGPVSTTSSKEPFVAIWKTGMQAGLGQRTVHRGEAKPAEPAKTTIQWARFAGDAVLRQGAQSLSGQELGVDLFDATDEGKQAIRRVTGQGQVAASQPGSGQQAMVGDLACENMRLDFVRNADGTSRPETLFAKGKVVGTQADGGIEAGEMKIIFAPDPKAPTKSKAVGLVADHNVRVRQKAMYAEAEHLETDETGDNLLLVGAEAPYWAMAQQGPNKIRGPKIAMSKSKQYVDVAGAGDMEISVDRDMEGRKLKEPSPLHLDWKRHMTFDGPKNVAHFSGAARTRMPTASVDSEDLWVFFTAAPAKSPSPLGEGAPSGAGEGLRPRTVGHADSPPTDQMFKNKSLSRLVALEKVTARSIDTPPDPKDDLEAATIRCERLEYSADDAKAYVPVPGTLEILSVGRDPETTSPFQRAPHSTVNVAWKKEMIFDRGKTALGYFSGDVACEIKDTAGKFSGKTGSKSAAAGGSSGLTTLYCQDLRLYFQNELAALDAASSSHPSPGSGGMAADVGRHESKTPDGTSSLLHPSPLGEGGPASGPGEGLRPATAPSSGNHGLTLTQLVASVNVSFRDGDRQARAARATYDRSRDLVDLVGTRDRPADIWSAKEQTFDPTKTSKDNSQQFNRVTGERVRYWRTSGAAEIINPGAITITPGK